ncbi:unnamed protein product [Amoebophrya sp. A120]|nr:unnamed protein product [Amoebophrya sp. A120]|eukprot:GSA120T00018231001.1
MEQWEKERFEKCEEKVPRMRFVQALDRAKMPPGRKLQMHLSLQLFELATSKADLGLKEILQISYPFSLLERVQRGDVQLDLKEALCSQLLDRKTESLLPYTLGFSTTFSDVRCGSAFRLWHRKLLPAALKILQLSNPWVLLATQEGFGKHQITLELVEQYERMRTKVVSREMLPLMKKTGQQGTVISPAIAQELQADEHFLTRTLPSKIDAWRSASTAGSTTSTALLYRVPELTSLLHLCRTSREVGNLSTKLVALFLRQFPDGGEELRDFKRNGATPLQLAQLLDELALMLFSAKANGSSVKTKNSSTEKNVETTTKQHPGREQQPLQEQPGCLDIVTSAMKLVCDALSPQDGRNFKKTASTTTTSRSDTKRTRTTRQIQSLWSLGAHETDSFSAKDFAGVDYWCSDVEPTTSEQTRPVGRRGSSEDLDHHTTSTPPTVVPFPWQFRSFARRHAKLVSTFCRTPFVELDPEVYSCLAHPLWIFVQGFLLARTAPRRSSASAHQQTPNLYHEKEPPPLLTVQEVAELYDAMSGNVADVALFSALGKLFVRDFVQLLNDQEVVPNSSPQKHLPRLRPVLFTPAELCVVAHGLADGIQLLEIEIETAPPRTTVGTAKNAEAAYENDPRHQLQRQRAADQAELRQGLQSVWHALKNHVPALAPSDRLLLINAIVKTGELSDDSEFRHTIETHVVNEKEQDIIQAVGAL